MANAVNISLYPNSGQSSQTAETGESGRAARRRVLRACLQCRGKKVKCNGERPTCGNCQRLRTTCQWSVYKSENTAAAITGSTFRAPDDPPAPSPNIAFTSCVPLIASPATSVTSSPPNPLTNQQCTALLGLFFSIPQLDVIRISVHRLTFEEEGAIEQPSFLKTAICCLASLFISDRDAVEMFNGEDRLTLSQRLASDAQLYSKATSDTPTLPNIQANLIMSYRELLCKAATTSWLYSGLAIRFSQALRLGRAFDYAHTSLEKEMRRRVLWTCFIMDRLVAWVLSRPVTLQTFRSSNLLPGEESAFLFGEESPSATIYTYPWAESKSRSVLPYFIKTIYFWGEVYDLYVSWLLNDHIGDETLTWEVELGRAGDSCKNWISRLPQRIQWSPENYRSFRLLNQGGLFVSLHMILNHTLMVAYYPQLPDHWADDPAQAQGQSWANTRSLDATLPSVRFANMVTTIAYTLYNGDNLDREILQSLFVGHIVVFAANMHLWQHYSGDRGQGPSSLTFGASELPATQIDFILTLFRAWQKRYMIAGAWLETLELLRRIYTVAYRQAEVEQEDENNDSNEVNNNTHLISVGSGIPGPLPWTGSLSLVKRTSIFMFSISEDSSVHRHAARLHMQSLWKQMLMQFRVLSTQRWSQQDDSGGSTLLEQGDNLQIFEN